VLGEQVVAFLARLHSTDCCQKSLFSSTEIYRDRVKNTQGASDIAWGLYSYYGLLMVRKFPVFALLALVTLSVSAQPPSRPTAATSAELAQADGESPARPELTEVWEPVPPAVIGLPATENAAPPPDAVVLFDGTDLDEWVNQRDGSAAGWTIADGVIVVDKQAGDIETRRRFGSYQLHLEWRIPSAITGSGQSRGNSGLFLGATGRGSGYELQILDSYENATYVNGMAGSIYKQSIPRVNASRPPGDWQTYDVIWTAPKFNADGSVLSPARVTALFNGLVVQNNFALSGETEYIGTPGYRAHGDLPIMLQAHGDPSPPISFRNIWVRPLP
jgi:hypothetical protein